LHREVNFPPSNHACSCLLGESEEGAYSASHPEDTSTRSPSFLFPAGPKRRQIGELSSFPFPYNFFIPRTLPPPPPLFFAPLFLELARFIPPPMPYLFSTVVPRVYNRSVFWSLPSVELRNLDLTKFSACCARYTRLLRVKIPFRPRCARVFIPLVRVALTSFHFSLSMKVSGWLPSRQLPGQRLSCFRLLTDLRIGWRKEFPLFPYVCLFFRVHPVCGFAPPCVAWRLSLFLKLSFWSSRTRPPPAWALRSLPKSSATLDAVHCTTFAQNFASSFFARATSGHFFWTL